MKLLSGKLALVTGAGRGIGKAIALTFAAEGADLVIASRTQSELQKIAAEARAYGVSVRVVTADVRNRDDAARVAQTAGAVDILVNNAGVYSPIGPFAETNLDEWWDALETNLGGTLRFCRAVIPGMITRGGGRIINLSGGGATSPLPNLTAYSVSKTAVVRLTENLAEELRPYNILVNAIAPGIVDTKLQDELINAGTRAGEDLLRRVRRARETGEGGVPPTLPAELALFLASSQSDGLTGKLIAAPHDPWREWAGRGAELSDSAIYTLRRLDPFTIRHLKDLL